MYSFPTVECMLCGKWKYEFTTVVASRDITFLDVINFFPILGIDLSGAHPTCCLGFP